MQKEEHYQAFVRDIVGVNLRKAEGTMRLDEIVLPPVWKESTLAPDQRWLIYVGRIRQKYGVDVSDVQDRSIASVVNRINRGQATMRVENG